MRKIPDRLVLFTQGFPFENGEVFLRREIEFLSREYERILIVPYYAVGIPTPLPPNVSTKTLPDIWEIPHDTWSQSFRKHSFEIFKFFFAEMRAQFRNSKVWKLARENFALVKYFYALSDLIQPIIEEFNPERTIFYSYWCNDRATLLGILKKAGKIKFAISRIHGFDLYADQNPYIRFRPFQVRNLDAILPISAHGSEYLKKLFPQSADRFHTFKLGVGNRNLNPFSATDIFTIVSCSAIASHKRVKEIATVVSGLDKPARWIHFGNGPELEAVMKIAIGAHEHIKIELRGAVPNDEILNFYETNCVHLFLNFSVVEGIPFSIMEAISFGIPVLGVDIGGISEIVTPKTGILLGPKALNLDLRDGINQFRDLEIFNPTFREGVKNFWAGNFDENHNFTQFIRFLKQV